MDTTVLHQDAPGYPSKLKDCLGNDAPISIVALGNLEILNHSHRLLALFCSVRCPGNLILQTHDFVQRLRSTDVSIVSGFHSPVERECLTILLRGNGPVIVCLARTLDGMRIPTAWRQPLRDGRLLLISPFNDKPHRLTAESAAHRNRIVAALAEEVLIAYAEPGGKLEDLCREAIAWGKPAYTLGREANNLIELGARAIRLGQREFGGS